jgi:tRNA-Thr(GGU) m(6)t(6)A37 methyltransferase TsaA
VREANAYNDDFRGEDKPEVTLGTRRALRGLSIGHHSLDEYTLTTIGHIRSTLRALSDAPRQGDEGAPDAWLDVDPAFTRALSGMATGDEIIVVTWLHRGDRTVLEVHPRNDPNSPLAGVFVTRSPDRPNPLGLHRVTVREISGTRLRIGPMEAVDGTPVVDIKIALGTT